MGYPLVRRLTHIPRNTIMNIWTKLFGGRTKAPTPANQNKRCSSCELSFLNEWIGKSAICSKCGQKRTLSKNRDIWNAYILPTEGADMQTKLGEARVREVIPLILSQPTPSVWILCFASGQAVHTFVDTMRGAAFLGIIPSTTTALPLVGSSPQNWQSYKLNALNAIRAFTGEATIIAAATDAHGDFRQEVEGIVSDRARLKFIGY